MPVFHRHRHTWPILICCCLGSAGMVAAQQPAQPAQPEASHSQIAPPSRPFVKTPAPGFQWNVEIRTTGGANHSPVPKRLEMQIGQNQVQQGTIEYANGQKAVFYSDGHSVYTQQGGTVVRMSPDDTPPINEDGLFVSAFPGVWWLSAGSYVGIESQNNTPCYKFKKERGGELLMAWVRVADRFPVRVQVGGTTYIFAGPVSFPDKVSLPQNIAAKMEKMKIQTRALKRILEENQ